ncbi:MAG: hypothetical protein AAF317_19505, partial [Pseudomonadota bacterium]
MIPAALRSVPGERGVVKRRSTRLGELLLERGEISPADLERALRAQHVSRQKLGDILIASGTVTDVALCEALAEQWGLGTADLLREAPDPALFEPADIDVCLRYRIVPWRAVGGLTAYVTAEPETAAEALAELSAAPAIAFVLLAPAAQVEGALAHGFGREFAEDAATKAPAEMSVRSLTPARRVFACALVVSV